MTYVELVEKKEISLLMRPNRALDREERRLCFFFIACTTLLIAGVATTLGAWMALPFAGLEVILVGLAFHVIGQHDNDYEMLVVGGESFRWELRLGRQLSTLSGNRRWLQVFSCTNRGLIDVSLSYAGKRVNVGILASDQQRRDLCSSLRRVLRQ